MIQAQLFCFHVHFHHQIFILIGHLGSWKWRVTCGGCCMMEIVNRSKAGWGSPVGRRGRKQGCRNRGWGGRSLNGALVKSSEFSCLLLVFVRVSCGWGCLILGLAGCHQAWKIKFVRVPFAMHLGHDVLVVVVPAKMQRKILSACIIYFSCCRGVRSIWTLSNVTIRDILRKKGQLDQSFEKWNKYTVGY